MKIEQREAGIREGGKEEEQWGVSNEKGGERRGHLTLQALCRGLYSSMVRLLLSVASARSTTGIMTLCWWEEEKKRWLSMKKHFSGTLLWHENHYILHLECVQLT